MPDRELEAELVSSGCHWEYEKEGREDQLGPARDRYVSVSSCPTNVTFQR